MPLKKTVLVLIGLLFLMVSAAEADGVRFTYSETGSPNGLTADPSPEISLFFRITEGRDEDFALKMFVNGRAVPANYDESSGTLAWQAADLSGRNTVRVELYLFGEPDVKKEWNWSFEVDGRPILPFTGLDSVLLEAGQGEAIERVNMYRNDLGLHLLRSSATLQHSAQAHANYLQQYPDDGHAEQSDRLGYTGSSPDRRAAYFGYAGRTGEGIAYGEPSASMAVDRLMDAPYHRISIIDPYFRELGAGMVPDGTVVLNYGENTSSDDASREVVVYPYDGQTGVKNSWVALETPHPLRFWDHELFVGYPISLNLFSTEGDRMVVERASLKDSQGENVPFYQIDPSIDSAADNHLFLIPQRPLTPGETYAASVEARIITQSGSELELTEQWSFTTASDIRPGEIHIQKNDNGFGFLIVPGVWYEDPEATYLLEKDGRTELRVEVAGRSQTGDASKLAEGLYLLKIDSPLYDERQQYEVRLVRRGPSIINPGGVMAVEWVEPPEAGLVLDGAVILNNSTLLPLRSLFEALGAEVKWDGAERTVTARKGETVIRMTIDQPEALLNGERVSLNTPAVIRDGRTLIPVRFAAEALGAEIEWIPSLRSAMVRVDGQTIQIRVN